MLPVLRAVPPPTELQRHLDSQHGGQDLGKEGDWQPTYVGFTLNSPTRGSTAAQLRSGDGRQRAFGRHFHEYT